MSKDRPDISIVIPAYNEAGSIEPLYNGITRVMRPLNRDYEIILIDDGSTDGTPEEMHRICSMDKGVKSVRLRRSFGKALALTIGFGRASGNTVITMDADLQDSPDEIPKFLGKIAEGWDLVCGWKRSRQDAFEKRISSKIFNFIVSRLSGLRIHDFNCGFKAYRKDVLETIRIYGGLYRFIPMIAHSYGFRICEIPVKHEKRRSGVTKFGKERYLAGFFDLFTAMFVTRYSRRPLQLLGRISMAAFIAGALLLLYTAVLKFIYGLPGNRPALFLSVFLLGLSVQIVLFGLLADLFSYTSQKRDFKEEDYIDRTTG